MIHGYSPDHEFFRKGDDTRPPLTGEQLVFYETLRRATTPHSAQEVANTAYPSSRIKRGTLAKLASVLVTKGWIRCVG